ncbi:MAG: hypothetical protein RLY93_10195 [Sumerlaeia bacterium]
MTDPLRAARRRLEPHLAPGEELLWAGQPDPRARFRKVDAVFVPFCQTIAAGVGLLWFGAVVLVFLTQGRFLFLPLLWLPFVVIAAYMVWGRFTVKRIAAENTAYGITDRGVLSVTLSPRRRVRRVEAASLRNVHRIVEPERRETLRFGDVKPYQALLDHSGVDALLPEGLAGPVAFHDLKDAEEPLRVVRELITATQDL